MKKINITTARKLFNKGEKIYVLPNKVALGNPWISPSSIEKINDETFDYIINAYCAFGYEHLDIAYYLQSGIYNHPVEPMEGEGNFITKLYSKDILFNAIKNLFGVGPSTYDINYN